MKRRLTMAQAIVAYLRKQFSGRDGRERRFIEGCFGIFGHGNVAGIGQALEQDPQLKYYLCRNEQAMVHTAAAFSKASFRLRTLACTTSIGPGATNMVTGAAWRRSIACRFCSCRVIFSLGGMWRRCSSNWNRQIHRMSL